MGTTLTQKQGVVSSEPNCGRTSKHMWVQYLACWRQPRRCHCFAATGVPELPKRESRALGLAAYTLLELPSFVHPFARSNTPFKEHPCWRIRQVPAIHNPCMNHVHMSHLQIIPCAHGSDQSQNATAGTEPSLPASPSPWHSSKLAQYPDQETVSHMH